MALGSRSVRTLLWGVVLMGVAALPVLGQPMINDIYLEQPISLFDPSIYEGEYGGMLAGFLPRYIEEPMDNLTPRPGADAMGMGGAYVARAEGAMAMGWNPAGLGLLEDWSLAVDGVIRSSGGTGSHLPDSITVRRLGDFEPTSYSADLTSGRDFEFLGAAAPLLRIGPRPLVGGIAYRRHTDVTFGLGTLLEMHMIGASGTAQPFTLGLDNQENGSINSFTIGLGYEVLSVSGFRASLGGTANFLTGGVRSDVQIRAAVRNFEEGRVLFQRDYEGFAVEAGGLLTGLDGRVRLGAWVSPSYTLSVSNSNFEGLQLIMPDDTEVDRLHGTIADFDLEVPLFTSFGVAVGPFRGIELTADANVRPWSKMKVKHTDPAYQQFDREGIAADVTSYHVGSRFQFPLLRGSLRKIGMRLDTQVGYRTLPLSMRERSLVDGTAPHYTTAQVEGDATDFGFTLHTGTEVTFHFAVEMQSYSYNNWFLEDQRSLEVDPQSGDPIYRELGFTNPYDAVTHIEQSNTLFRFSADMRL
jgi:hypothetical protein